MAKRAVSVCDIDDREGRFVPAIAQVRVETGGRTAQVDVCQEHLDALNVALAGLLPTTARRGPAARATRRPRKATQAARARKSTRTRATPRRRVLAGPSPDVVRAWARENGFEVKDRGRLSKEILDGYTATAS